MKENLINYLAVLVFAVVILEIYFAAKWNAAYFRGGIPLYSSRIEGKGFLTLPSTDSLTYDFDGGFIFQSLIFKTLGKNDRFQFN